MEDAKCAICRRQGEKLFLKGEKCYTPKCPFVKKSYPPGIHGRKNLRRKRPLSEYGFQLQNKQKLKFFYGLRERQFKNYVNEALRKKGANKATVLIQLLESRLDNIIFRLGWVNSRSVARQIVNHGHILVNGEKVNIPSYRAKMGDKIAIKPKSLTKKMFEHLDITLKKHETPGWLKLSSKTKEGEIIKNPQIDNLTIQTDANSIIEFYSR